MGERNKNSNKYLAKKQEELKEVEQRINKAEIDIQRLENLNKEYNDRLDKEKIKNVVLNTRYNALVKKMKSEGAIFEIENQKFDIREWENLNLGKEGRNYVLKTVYGNVIYKFDHSIGNCIGSLISNNEFSFIVVRVEKSKLKVQFRLK